MFIKKASFALMLTASLFLQSIPGISSAGYDSSLIYKNNFINNAFALTTTPTKSTLIYGDLNNDRIVDSADYSSLRRFLLGLTSEFQNPKWKEAADVNLDESIDSADYTILRAYLLEKINTLPVGSKPEPTSSTPIPTSPITTPGSAQIMSEDVIKITAPNYGSVEVSSQGRPYQRFLAYINPEAFKDVIKVEYNIDGVVYEGKSTSPYEFTLNEGYFPYGDIIKVFVIASNSSGDKIQSKTYTFGIHWATITARPPSPKPEIEIISPYTYNREGNLLKESATFESKISDPNFTNITKVEYNINNETVLGETTPPYRCVYNNINIPSSENYFNSLYVSVVATNDKGEKLFSKNYKYTLRRPTPTPQYPNPTPE